MKHLIHFFLSAVITGILLYAVFCEQSLDQFGSVLSNVHTGGLLSYIALSLMALVFRTLRYKWVLTGVLGKEESPNIKKTLIVTAVRNALVDFLPARLGELSFFYILKSYGVSLFTATTAFGLCLALDILVLLGMLLIAILTFSGSFITAFSSSNSMVALCASVLILWFLIHFMDVILLRLSSLIAPRNSLSFINKVLLWLSSSSARLAEEFARIRKSRQYSKLVIITLCLRTAKYGSLYLLLLAVLHQWDISFNDINFLISFVAFVSAEAAASLPISGFMGFGAYEGAWSAVFQLNKVQVPNFPSVILAVHLITQVVGYFIGFAGLLGFLITRLKKLEDLSRHIRHK